MKYFSALATAVSMVASMMLSCGTSQSSVIYNGGSVIGGNTATAQVTFTIAGNALSITLQNTSPLPATGTYKPGDTLTGLSFRLAGATLTKFSAVSPNALFLGSPCSAGPGPCSGLNLNIGGEWGFSNHFPAAGSYGLAAAGYSSMPGNFGNGSTFPGAPNLDNPVAPGGVNFGIVSALTTAGNINGGLTEPMVRDTAIFTLLGAQGFLETSIADVMFWYGTAPESSTVGILYAPGCSEEEVGACDVDISVPEPGSLLILLVALISMVLFTSGRRIPLDNLRAQRIAMS